MTTVSAWLLDLGTNLRAAVGERELLHLLPEVTLHAVPCAPRHCCAVIEHRGAVLPVWNVATWIDPARAQVEGNSLIAVVAYQRRARENARFGALALQSPPSRIKVTDTMACELAHDAHAWRSIAISCFAHDGQPVPVLDLRRMFSSVPQVAPAPVRTSAERALETISWSA